MPETNAMTPSRGFRAARFGPIELRVDSSWFIWVAILAVFAHASVPVLGRPGVASWVGAALLATFISACVVVHELAHSVTAIAYGLPVRRITLFLFGGVSHIEREAPTASIEFQVALAGPLTSLVIATVFGGLAVATHPAHHLAGVWGFISYINGWLAVFNLLPAFPMDGGRVLRSALWGRRRSRARATHWAGVASRALATVFIAGGVLLFGATLIGKSDDPLGGIWIAGIGFFLYNAASVAERVEGGDLPNERRGT